MRSTSTRPRSRRRAPTPQANGVALHAGLPERAHGRYELVLANILATPLKLLAPLLCATSRRAATLVLAGILERQADELKAAYAPWLRSSTCADSEDGWILMTGAARHGRRVARGMISPMSLATRCTPAARCSASCRTSSRCPRAGCAAAAATTVFNALEGLFDLEPRRAAGGRRRRSAAPGRSPAPARRCAESASTPAPPEAASRPRRTAHRAAPMRRRRGMPIRRADARRRSGRRRCATLRAPQTGRCRRARSTRDCSRARRTRQSDRSPTAPAADAGRRHAADAAAASPLESPTAPEFVRQRRARRRAGAAAAVRAGARPSLPRCSLPRCSRCRRRMHYRDALAARWPAAAAGARGAGAARRLHASSAPRRIDALTVESSGADARRRRRRLPALA